MNQIWWSSRNVLLNLRSWMKKNLTEVKQIMLWQMELLWSKTIAYGILIGNWNWRHDHVVGTVDTLYIQLGNTLTPFYYFHCHCAPIDHHHPINLQRLRFKFEHHWFYTSLRAAAPFFVSTRFGCDDLLFWSSQPPPPSPSPSRQTRQIQCMRNSI